MTNANQVDLDYFSFLSKNIDESIAVLLQIIVELNNEYENSPSFLLFIVPSITVIP